MATIILKDAFIEFDGNDISAHGNQVTIEYSADEVEDTNFGDDTHQFMAGSLKNWSASITLAQDYASGEIDDTLFALVGSGGTLKIRPKSSAVAVDNPEYSGDAVLLQYNPVSGSVGERVTTEISLQPWSEGASPDLTRATA